MTGWFEADDKHNTKVYVSNLPEEMSLQEFVDLMQKCGLVLKNAESGEYKVKMYRDSEGHFKGDALCSYIKVRIHFVENYIIPSLVNSKIESYILIIIFVYK